MLLYEYFTHVFVDFNETDDNSISLLQFLNTNSLKLFSKKLFEMDGLILFQLVWFVLVFGF